MKYEFQKDFFLVYNINTKDRKLFHLWSNVVRFLVEELMKNDYWIIYDEDNSDWRAPKNSEECFDFLFYVENLYDLNDVLEDLWQVQLVRFAD